MFCLFVCMRSDLLTLNTFDILNYMYLREGKTETDREISRLYHLHCRILDSVFGSAKGLALIRHPQDLWVFLPFPSNGDRIGLCVYLASILQLSHTSSWSILVKIKGPPLADALQVTQWMCKLSYSHIPMVYNCTLTCQVLCKLNSALIHMCIRSHPCMCTNTRARRHAERESEWEVEDLRLFHDLIVTSMLLILHLGKYWNNDREREIGGGTRDRMIKREPGDHGDAVKALQRLEWWHWRFRRRSVMNVRMWSCLSLVYMWS